MGLLVENQGIYVRQLDFKKLYNTNINTKTYKSAKKRFSLSQITAIQRSIIYPFKSSTGLKNKINKKKSLKEQFQWR